MERMIYLKQWWQTYVESIDYAGMISDIVSVLVELVVTIIVFWLIKKIL